MDIEHGKSSISDSLIVASRRDDLPFQPTIGYTREELVAKLQEAQQRYLSRMRPPFNPGGTNPPGAA